MKLSEMKQALADGDIQLTKSLGQNFLHDGNQLRRIVDAAELSTADKVFEIGPGLGPLTELLMAQAGEVFAIEKDLRLVEFLKKRFAPADKLKLLHDDALDFIKREGRDWSAWKLVANLPYSVASPIIVELAMAKGCPERLVVTLQLEVVQRLVARADSDHYGLLTLLVQLHYEPHGWFKIPSNCFHPAPDVDSGCVTLIRRAQPLLDTAQGATFTRIVKRGFSQRRKMMFKLLKQDWPEAKLSHAFSELELDTQVRAEKLSLEHFVALTQLLHKGDDLFDIVNEHDEVIGQRPRREVHALALLHRAAHILVFNHAGEIFLQKRSMTKDNHPGVWDASCSGHVDAGEDYLTAARRELGEEIGLHNPEQLEPLFKLTPCEDTGQEFIQIFRTQAEGPFTLHPEEIDDGKWIAPTALDRWMAEHPHEFSPSFRLNWRNFRTQGG